MFPLRIPKPPVGSGSAQGTKMSESQTKAGKICNLKWLSGCHEQVEDIQHVLHCPATAPARVSLLKELQELVESANLHINYVSLSQNKGTMTQFLLDCSSQNLAPGLRVDQNEHMTVHTTMDVFKICRRIINATHCMRIKLLRTIIT